MGRHRCRCPVPGCFAWCVVVVRMSTDSGPGEPLHYCQRHYERVLAEAERRSIPVIDKRVVRDG